MTPPRRRRSSRLRGSSVTPKKPINYTANRLESLTEHDETPAGVQSNLDAIVSSPPRTPATAGRVVLSKEEMHPKMAHQSTTKEPDSGLRLGFADVEAAGTHLPSGFQQQTPSKVSTPTFDFRFARPAPQLGPEAQRMMDELREEALRIKVKLAAEREEEQRHGGEGSNVGLAGRKIAQPKGKVGRFSEVHMSEFKKMDSIAGHPSAFRAQPGRFAAPTTASLKRSPSKAQLDNREETHRKTGQASEESDRMENTAPAKRARKHVGDDTSSSRSVPSNDKIKPMTPTLPHSRSGYFSSITTPTQASLARVSSVKKSGTQLPTLSRSPSKPNLIATPKGLTKSATMHNLGAAPRSEPAPKSFIPSPGKFDRVKSILRYPSSSKNPRAMPTSIPRLSRSPSKPNLDKSLPSIPTTPGGNYGPQAAKHVNFTPQTINKHAAIVQNSPSPLKSGIAQSTSKNSLPAEYINNAKVLANVQYPTVADLPSLEKDATKVEYPSLIGVRPLPEVPRQSVAQPQLLPSVPGAFTFRSELRFGTSPVGFGSSPGQASVRQVRHSIFPQTMPGSFPGTNKENNEPLPALSHGISNKKRCRADSDDETEEELERSPKKHKAAAAEGHMLMAPNFPQAERMTPKTKPASPAKKRGVLSLSRLNMLARPKMRK